MSKADEFYDELENDYQRGPTYGHGYDRRPKWDGHPVRVLAESIVCRACFAQIGNTCVNSEGVELTMFPAHAVRMSDSQKGRE
jgi:hypothetical protein